MGAKVSAPSLHISLSPAIWTLCKNEYRGLITKDDKRGRGL